MQKCTSSLVPSSSSSLYGVKQVHRRKVIKAKDEKLSAVIKYLAARILINTCAVDGMSSTGYALNSWAVFIKHWTNEREKWRIRFLSALSKSISVVRSKQRIYPVQTQIVHGWSSIYIFLIIYRTWQPLSSKGTRFSKQLTNNREKRSLSQLEPKADSIRSLQLANSPTLMIGFKMTADFSEFDAMELSDKSIKTSSDVWG